MLGAGRRLGSRAAYEAKTLVAASPRLTVAAARWRGHGEVVGPGSDILIEGYPRSANQFSVAAFRLAQGRPMRVAHHTHAPGHVLAALRLHVPAIVLIRDPCDSVLEFVLVRPTLTVRQALRGWIRFYSALQAHRARFVTGPFSEVTSDFGAVIRRANERFGSAFVPFDHTEENVRECFRQMDAYWEGRIGATEELERYVGRPSATRDRWKDDLLETYLRLSSALRSGAEELYRNFAGGAS